MVKDRPALSAGGSSIEWGGNIDSRERVDLAVLPATGLISGGIP
ncbi:MAG: hypothetical protein ACYTBZ_06940 [Planctomycetota bacterium]|jgi:hypothetical protein